ncbi:beta-galactosidase [Devosia nitrariae]|uniref:beta-galactosidase n=1 Tax=Devosia nitrariae TaxID=2071872 RepID=A0ABQ5W812_9HYPH|nr:beta-galactosidase [Devosia nitrariae]GLQ56173.1 beta-galactosidase [Devosia nitrariae]
MPVRDFPLLPYGAVYFRKSNPPPEDWERDYRVAAEDGFNIFRHWFMWSAIEVRPGVFDWDDYDRQFELAARYGIKTIIAEMITAAPEWLYHERPEGRYLHADGRPHMPVMGVSSATGGFHGMCLDDDVVRERAGQFLTALAERYRDHPAMGGYDIWNECNYSEDTGYSPATLGAFRRWLEARYGTPEALGRAWGRYSFADWSQVTPPAQLQLFADSLDWLEFLQDNAFAQMRWRVDTIRAVDPKNLISAHGIAASIVSAANKGSDDWRSADEVELYGFTWAPSRQGDKAYQPLHAVDLTRAASRGKPFWHAEAQGGPLWLQPQVFDRPLDDGRITQPEDLRIWNMTSFAGGARGLLYPRWRPLLDGPLFGAFGPYAMDGSRTARSEMASRIAKWAAEPAQSALWQSVPITGEVGLLYVPETQNLDFALQGRTDSYTAAMRGAYQGFFENNIQADFVHVEDIDAYRFVYLPYPIHLKPETAKRIGDWVEAGGVLVAEGLPGYFGTRGRVDTVQPGQGLHDVFGALEADVQFAPDLFGELALEVFDHQLVGGVFRQMYTPTTGRAAGTYADGGVAAVTHQFGRGKTLLIGSYPSVGFARNPSDSARAFFRHLLDWSGGTQRIVSDNRGLTARLQDGEGGRFVFVLNHTREAQSARLRFAGDIRVALGEPLWGGDAALEADNNVLAVTVGARDALILKLG